MEQFINVLNTYKETLLRDVERIIDSFASYASNKDN